MTVIDFISGCLFRPKIKAVNDYIFKQLLKYIVDNVSWKLFWHSPWHSDIHRSMNNEMGPVQK